VCVCVCVVSMMKEMKEKRKIEIERCKYDEVCVSILVRLANFVLAKVVGIYTYVTCSAYVVKEAPSLVKATALGRLIAFCQLSTRGLNKVGLGVGLLAVALRGGSWGQDCM
jgi:hypothetical protein